MQFLFGTNILGAIGYAILIGASNNAVKYFACFVCTIAVYNGTGLNLAWLNVNMAPQCKLPVSSLAPLTNKKNQDRRATAIGIQQTIGNSAGAVAGQIYRSTPYLLGNSFSLGAIFVAECLVTIHWFYLRRQEKEKREILAGNKEDKRAIQSGDRDIHFRYRL